jgi:type IV pilus assembly protein PilE
MLEKLNMGSIARVHTRYAAGFTLIELMIAVVVVAILASIALPSYSAYVLRAQRSAAKTTLLDLASRQESFFTDRKRYATTLTALGFAGDTVYALKDGTLVDSDGSDAVYKLAIASGATATSYTLTATPIHQQLKDSRCGTLSLDSTGTRSASGSDGIECWRR